MVYLSKYRFFKLDVKVLGATYFCIPQTTRAHVVVLYPMCPVTYPPFISCLSMPYNLLCIFCVKGGLSHAF